MVLCIGIEQPSDHPLVLRAMFSGLVFEEVHTSLTQGNGDLDSLIPKDQVLRPRKEVRNDL